MSITRNVAVALASLSLGGALSTTFVFAQSAHVLVPADKVQWGPAPPVLPAGAEIAVLEGNPSEKGAVTLRLRFPANYNIPPHWHSMAERVTVLSGTFNVGMGDKLDRHASQALEPGGFVSLPREDAPLRLDRCANGRADQSGRAVRHLLCQPGRQPADEDVDDEAVTRNVSRSGCEQRAAAVIDDEVVGRVPAELPMAHPWARPPRHP